MHAYVCKVLAVLIRNAIRYSDRGDTVQVCVSLDLKNLGGVKFSVRDSGPGIPAAKRKSLFKNEGTKLFWFASKVALHGGTVSYEVPGAGVGAVTSSHSNSSSSSNSTTSGSGSTTGSEKPGSEFCFSVNLEEVEEGDDDDY